MKRKWLWVLIALVVLLLAAAPAGLEPYPYFMHIAIVALFYAILASSWSLLAGYAGQFSFAHMAFMAIGAYAIGANKGYLYVRGEYPLAERCPILRRATSSAPRDRAATARRRRRA